MTIIEDFIGIEFGIDQVLILGVIIAAIKRKKSFFVDWAPFLLFWVIYDLSRGIADDQKHINVTPIYDLELKLFGWLFGGKVPPFWAQEHQSTFLTVLFGLFYSMHMVAPLLVGLAIYYKSKDRDTFKEFSYSFLLTSYMGLLTFIFYPVAPPWYVYNKGGEYNFNQPEQLVNVKESAAGLVDFDKVLGKNIFSSFYETFNSNPYAALPSLHAAYAFFTAYFVIYMYGKKYGKKTWLVWLYPIGVWTAAVYLNHHYIVDLLLGVFYSYISIRFIRFIRPRIIKFKSKYRDEKNQSEKPTDKVNIKGDKTIEQIDDTIT